MSSESLGTESFLENPDQVARYLTELLRDNEGDPDAIKAGIRYAILSLRHIAASRKLGK
jgi:hypothetical protein